MMKKVLRLQGLCCANCAAKIERSVLKIKGVDSASVSFMAQKMVLECDESIIPDVMEQIRTIVAKIEPDCRVIG